MYLRKSVWGAVEQKSRGNNVFWFMVTLLK
jgi:hypothetical protein